MLLHWKHSIPRRSCEECPPLLWGFYECPLRLLVTLFYLLLLLQSFRGIRWSRLEGLRFRLANFIEVRLHRAEVLLSHARPLTSCHRTVFLRNSLARDCSLVLLDLEE